MAQSYLVFDFGSNEEAAEQARRTIDRWKQAFRLGKKVMMKFDRRAPQDTAGTVEPAGSGATGAANSAHTPAGDAPAPQVTDQVTLIVCLEFSDHERLSQQRWLARIPAEPPFKDAQPKTIAPGDPEFADVAEQFQGGAGRPHGFTTAPR